MIPVYGQLKIINYENVAVAARVRTGGGSDFELLKAAVSFVSRFSAKDDPQARRRVPYMQLAITLRYISIRPQPT